MRKAIYQAIVLAGLCALLLPVSLMAADMTKMPAADGQALQDYITKTDPYAKWDLMPGTTKMRQGKEPHGALQNVYVNKAALKAIKDKAGAMPDGAIVVKENYMADKKLSSVTVLYKKKGFNPEAGDYMWLKYGADMKILAQGKPAPCIQCHTQAKANDYVILAPLK
ncbi:MAG: cytochrome P460 family protein [Humidesulfovibrio sp.]|jgi:hypothetical protein|nr:cytochrome P460 family protein [Humidesulfovibrio sp.]PKN07032.1 MAG: hypothetical protein CVU73_14430 [Deltaproteobacteria bacterium HGW-Deltaproteobacteria-8]